MQIEEYYFGMSFNGLKKTLTNGTFIDSTYRRLLNTSHNKSVCTVLLGHHYSTKNFGLNSHRKKGHTRDE